MCILYKYYFSESEIVETWNKTGVMARKNSFLAPDLEKEKKKTVKRTDNASSHIQNWSGERRNDIFKL